MPPPWQGFRNRSAMGLNSASSQSVRRILNHISLNIFLIMPSAHCFNQPACRLEPESRPLTEIFLECHDWRIVSHSRIGCTGCETASKPAPESLLSLQGWVGSHLPNLPAGTPPARGQAPCQQRDCMCLDALAGAV